MRGRSSPSTACRVRRPSLRSGSSSESNLHARAVAWSNSEEEKTSGRPGCCRMRNLFMVVGMGISCAAWIAATEGAAEGHGGAHGGGLHGPGGRAESVRHGGVHSDISGILMVSQVLHEESTPGPVAPEMFSGVPSQHLVSDHAPGPSDHPFVRAPLRVERGEVVTTQPTAPAAGSDDRGGATAQPNPTGTPWSPRPPGVAGPGRRVSGQPGPGLPGPGRRTVPRW